jgi:formylglycine-generating enzyme required for sulfatase activity/proteasome lid subunit RPN8/RPN11
MDDPIIFPDPLYKRLLAEAAERYPRKTYGYLLSRSGPRQPTDFILFQDNIRNSNQWQPEFHSYGHYFVEHADAGFVATPEESWLVQREIWSRGMYEIGVFHSHQRHPANFSQIDWDLHKQRFCDLWHLIVSFRNPRLPQLRAFVVAEHGVREIPLRVTGRGHRPGHRAALTRDAAISRLRAGGGRPGGHPDPRAAASLLAAATTLQVTAGDDVLREVLAETSFRDRAARYTEHIAPLMEPAGPARFEMGSDQAATGHFCGESPRHTCELPAFRIMRVPVTAAVFSLIDRGAGESARAGRDQPAVNLDWRQAALFALWMGCRLPTEAEWEYCCGAGSPGQWCCETEEELPGYAWYCANSHDRVHPVATREPNRLGLFDLHGNVWEWCLDDYSQDFYHRAPQVGPVNVAGLREATSATEKVVRGGSMNGLAEMCRTRYRFHETATFSAADLGFRLAKDGG